MTKAEVKAIPHFQGKPYQQWAKGTRVLMENQMCRRVQAGRQTCRFLRERESHQDGFLVVGQKAVLVVVHGQLKEGTEDEVWQKVDDSDVSHMESSNYF
ncbi:MAG: hypothetical protein L6R36_004190 [Xanthoria steineri]|nr:MAG: hypothetical protein L6R36_004190 [Xanthoria steineri]